MPPERIQTELRVLPEFDGAALGELNQHTRIGTTEKFVILFAALRMTAFLCAS
jgi:hypothetical protein